MYTCTYTKYVQYLLYTYCYHFQVCYHAVVLHLLLYSPEARVIDGGKMRLVFRAAVGVTRQISRNL